MICPHCQKEFNAGKVMGGARSKKKLEAARKRGEAMKRAFANQRKMEELGQAETPAANVAPSPAPEPVSDLRVMPKGSLTKEDLKAMLAGQRGGKSEAEREAVEPWKDLSQTPCAPFDVNVEGEPHRVTQQGKKLALFYLGAGEPAFARYLNHGELETLWARRVSG